MNFPSCIFLRRISRGCYWLKNWGISFSLLLDSKLSPLLNFDLLFRFEVFPPMFSRLLIIFLNIENY